MSGYAWNANKKGTGGVDLSAFKGLQVNSKPIKKGVESFIDAMASRGIMVDPIADGKIHRCHVEGDKSRSMNGWYILFNDGLYAGSFGSWKEGWSEKWCELSYDAMDDAERLEHKIRMDNAARMREAEQQVVWNEKAEKAKGIYAGSSHPVSTHPYLDAKGVKAYDIRLSGNALVIPLMNKHGEIRSIQYINTDGSKRFLSGGQKRGLAFCINGDNETVVICEGYSTGATIHEATGATVFVAFDSGNLKPVSEWVRDIYPHVVIGADDDAYDENNVGLNKAEETGLPVVKPLFVNTEGNPTDFNDMYQRQGLGAVREMFVRKHKLYELKEDEAAPIDEDLINPHFGVMAVIVEYYNTTATRAQPLFAIQTALAVGSVILGRRFKTNFNNYSALYFLNVALSATGKEHPKTVAEDILRECGKDYIANDGFTSPAAVFSALHARPKCLSVIDEFGLYMKEAGTSRSSQVGEANSMLMQTIGRCHGVLRPRNYSSVTSDKKKAEEVAKKMVVKPSLTIIAGTTPGTLFENISKDQVKDGFIGRFITAISYAKRTVMQAQEELNPALIERIKIWESSISMRLGEGNLSSIIEPESDVEVEMLKFSYEADQCRMAFEQKCIDLMNSLDRKGIAEIAGRTNEFAMRMALIVALLENPDATIIEHRHIDWASRYVWYMLDGMITAIEKNMHGSQFEKDKMEVLEAMRKLGERGLTPNERNRVKPFSKYEKRRLDEIIEALISAGLVSELSKIATKSAGRPRVGWQAIKRE